jgi:DNA-binding NtrC family response regulator
MKRVVLQIEPAEPSAGGDSTEADPKGGREASPGETGQTIVRGPIRIEAELTEAQLQAIFDGLLDLPGSNDADVLVSDMVRAELREAGPEARDLYERIVVKVEREVVSRVYAECDYTQTLAADRLGINRNTLHKKLLQFQLLADAQSESEDRARRGNP